jgi:dTDP-4-amino-4,6-dideoxygalactose transaminase
MSRHAWSRYTELGSWAYEVIACGFKYNLSDIASAIGLVQLARLEAMNQRRREIAQAYTAGLSDVPELEVPSDDASGHCWHLYVLRLNLEKLSIDRARFFDEMKARGIGCSVHFIPIPLHGYYRGAVTLRDPCERALREYPRMLSLPLYSRLDDEQVQRVVTAVREIVGRYKVRRMAASAGWKESAA